MSQEKTEQRTSSGAVVFRETKDRRQYLVMKGRTGDWEFPKGTVEDGEELQQTTLREIKEETGIERLEMIDGFRQQYSYTFYDSGTRVEKTVHLFIVKSKEPDATLSSEHHDYQWCEYQDALGTLSHEGPKRILRNAKDFIEN